MFEALSVHAEHAFLRLKADRKIPVFEDSILGEPGELVLKEWVEDPLIADEYRRYVVRRS
jgi:hypothetical protein